MWVLNTSSGPVQLDFRRRETGNETALRRCRSSARHSSDLSCCSYFERAVSPCLPVLLLLICGAPQQRGGVRRGRSRASGKRPHGLAHGLYLRADGADEPLFVPRGHRAPRLISVHGDGAPVT